MGTSFTRCSSGIGNAIVPEEQKHQTECYNISAHNHASSWMEKYSNTNEVNDDVLEEIFPEKQYPDLDDAAEAPYLNYLVYHSLMHKIHGAEYLIDAISKIARFQPSWKYEHTYQTYPFFNFNVNQLRIIGI